MEMALGIIGTLTGVFGVIFSLLSSYYNRIEAVNALHESFRSPEIVNSKRVVRDLPCNYNPEKLSTKEMDEIAYLIISYMQAGILVRKRHLPFWVFEGHFGYITVYFYEKLLPYIKMRRGDGERNPEYAADFEYLYKRIKKKQHKNFGHTISSISSSSSEPNTTA